MPEGGGVGEEEETHLLRAFEEIQYLIEDLDNANSTTGILVLALLTPLTQTP